MELSAALQHAMFNCIPGEVKEGLQGCAFLAPPGGPMSQLALDLVAAGPVHAERALRLAFYNIAVARYALMAHMDL